MRKHFLLLFLMALLPLGAFAEDITPSMFVVSDITYGTTFVPATHVAAAGMTLNNDYTVDGTTFYKDDQGTPTTAADLSKAGYLNKGDYYVKITGAGGFSGVIYKKITIKAKEVRVKFTGTSIYFGSAIPAAATLYAHTWEEGYTLVVKKTDDFANDDDPVLNPKYGTDGTETNVKRAGGALDGAVEGYPYSCESKDANYDIKISATSGKFTINPIALPAYDATKYTYTIPTGKKYVYTGADQTNLPTVGIKPTATTSLTADTDYKVVWYNANITTSVTDNTYLAANKENPKVAAKAGVDVVYYAQVEGIGNYTGAVNSYEEATAAKQWKMTVEKKPIMVYVQPMSKTYDGKQIAVTVDEGNTNITDANIIVTTWANAADKTALEGQLKAKFHVGDYTDADFGGAEGAAATEVAKWNAAATAPVNYLENGYPMVAYAVLPAAGALLTDNYEPEFLKVGVLTINQRNVTVTAKRQTKTFTGNVVDFNHALIDGTTVEIQKATYAPTDVSHENPLTEEGLLYDESLTTATKEYFSLIKNPDVTEDFQVKKVYTNGITVKATAYAAGKNYNIIPVAADFEITGKPLTIIANTPADKEYGYILKAEDLTYVTNAGSLQLTKTPTYVVTKGEDTYTIDGETILPRGTYTITITPDATLAPDGYTIADDAYYPGTLTVGKKNLKVKVADQTLSQNTADPTSDATLIKEEGFYEFVEGFGPENGEKVKIQIQKTAAFTLASLGEVADAITVAMVAPTEAEATAKTYSNDNYILEETNITKGKVIVVGANTVILNRVKKADQTNAALNTAAALIDVNNNLEHANVIIKYNDEDDYNTFNANQWYAMVLPFATDVKTISAAFGYAIVDVVRKENTDVNRIYFDLKLDKDVIPANTPFIVKVWDDINMKTTGVTFNDVKILKPAATNGNLIASDNAGNQFIGTYEGIIGFGGAGSKDYWFSLADGEYKQPSATAYLRQMSAYIKIAGTSEAHEIIIEELGGQTTVIRSINADTQVFSGEDWYTLNGVKLQGVPTQKGIYIQNGKKVVIK